MFTVYSGRGAQDYDLEGPALRSDRWDVIRAGAVRLLRSRRSDEAADLLETLPFELRAGSNFFGDDFVVLYAHLPADDYIDMVGRFADPEDRDPFREIARAVTELTPSLVRFIEIDTAGEVELPPVEEPELTTSNRAVEEALSDARHLISGRGSTSGVDRAHTAFHGYLRQLCADADIDVPVDADVTRLFRALRDNHPQLAESGARGGDITGALRGLSQIVGVLNPLRNRASLAHPNEELLEEAEADLVLNCIRTLLNYIERRLGG